MSVMKTKSIITLLTLTALKALVAQPASQPSLSSVGDLPFLDSSDEALGSFSSKATQEAQAYLTLKKRQWEAIGAVGQVGSSTIEVPPTHKKYHSERSNAFDKAMLDLKEKIAVQWSAEIAAEMSQSFSKPKASEEIEDFRNRNRHSNASSSDKLGIVDKTKLIIHDELDSALKRRGIKRGTPQAQQVAKATLQTKFQSKIQVLAKAEIGAIIVSKVFESGQNIAVVGFYSDRSKKLQAAILGALPPNQAPKNPANGARPTLDAWAQGLSITDLYSSHGVQVKTDRNGDFNLISYSQFPAVNKSPQAATFARKEAGMIALGRLRSYAGEALKSNALRDTFTNSAQFDNGAGNVEQLVDGNSAFDQDIKTKAASLSFPGIRTLRTWQTIDSRTGTPICGHISVWNVTQAIAGATTARDALPGGNGGRGVTGTVLENHNYRPGNRTGFDPTKQNTGTTIIQGLESEDF